MSLWRYGQCKDSQQFQRSARHPLGRSETNPSRLGASSQESEAVLRNIDYSILLIQLI